MKQNKKILLFIVEGISDREALYASLENIFQSNSVIVRVVGSDLTSDIFIKQFDIKSAVTNQIKKELGKVFKPSDIERIIHIVDTDGAFIDPKNIIEDKSVTDPIYKPNRIICNNKQAIICRNEMKTTKLNILCSLHKIYNINYSVYFFSSNLDHVLHNDPNLNKDEKCNKAYQFAIKYEKSTNFIDFFNNTEYSILTSYDESWKFIKEDCNSLKRYTNFGLLLNNNT